MTPCLRALVLLAVSAILASGCRSSAAKAELPADDEQIVTPVRAVRPLPTLTSSDADVVGSVRSKNMVTLSAKTTGQIVKLDVEVGDPVKKGQILVQQDTSSTSAALSSAQAAVRLADIGKQHAHTELERAKSLHAGGALNDAALDGAKTQYDAACAQVDQARAAVRSTQQMIADATLRSPFDGVVSARFANQGEQATAMPPTRLLTVVDPDALEVRLSVPEPLIAFVKVGDTLAGRVSPSDKAIEVRVTALSRAVDERSRTVEVLADVVSTKAANLLVGMIVTVDAAGSQDIAGPFLPAAAVHKDEKGQFVLLVKEGKLERVGVEAKPLNPGLMAVPSGLANDAVVAVDETGALGAGDRVRVIDSEGATGG